MKSLPIIGALEKKEQEIYDAQINPLLPSRILDFHAHAGLQENFRDVSEKRKMENIGVGIAYYLPIEDLILIYEKIFKGKIVESVVCPFPFRECKAAEANEYISKTMGKHKNVEGFFLADPESTEEEMRNLLLKGGFKGLKPYPDRVAGKAWNDISVYDCITPAMLKIADEYKLPIFLHVPKDTRLASPETIREIREISRRFPDVTVVLAHIGRLHCPPLIETGISGVADLQNIFFETSLATNPDAFKLVLETAGPERLIFGTDLPASLVRGKIICAGEKRIWAVREKYPWVKDEDRKLYEKELGNLIPMVYESILAFKKAIVELNISKNDVEKMFYRNAINILDSAEVPASD
mgnify:CR=1 FL=1